MSAALRAESRSKFFRLRVIFSENRFFSGSRASGPPASSRYRRRTARIEEAGRKTRPRHAGDDRSSGTRRRRSDGRRHRRQRVRLAARVPPALRRLRKAGFNGGCACLNAREGAALGVAHIGGNGRCGIAELNNRRELQRAWRRPVQDQRDGGYDPPRHRRRRSTHSLEKAEAHRVVARPDRRSYGRVCGARKEIGSLGTPICTGRRTARRARAPPGTRRLPDAPGARMHSRQKCRSAATPWRLRQSAA